MLPSWLLAKRLAETMLHGSTLEAGLTKARALAHAGNLPGAVKALREVVASGEADARVFSMMAVYEVLQGHTKPATTLALEALALDPGESDAHFALAHVWLARRRWKKAEAAINQAIALAPLYGPYRGVLATVLEHRQKLKPAEENLRAWLALEPDSSAPIASLAWFLIENGRPQEAAPLVETALRLDPHDTQTLGAAARLAIAEHKPELAHGFVSDMLRIDGNDQQGLALLALLKAQKNALLGAWWRFNVAYHKHERWLRYVWIVVFVLAGRTLHAADSPLRPYEQAAAVFVVAVVAFVGGGALLFRRMVKREIRPVALQPGF